MMGRIYFNAPSYGLSAQRTLQIRRREIDIVAHVAMDLLVWPDEPKCMCIGNGSGSNAMCATNATYMHCITRVEWARCEGNVSHRQGLLLFEDDGVGLMVEVIQASRRRRTGSSIAHALAKGRNTRSKETIDIEFLVRMTRIRGSGTVVRTLYG
ncbi:hypothetical protein AG1IA_08922 [Rhizoctonia solani AG-1 IA]|uniref:Uncharacterized protein n=1 Tax=Thanatephorus cucumeris (strain AG1-IA) TaxID=983506 RepID=L8WJQ8_THACA|nr:hypothetical protein AG1IA_08922 [Rhizoctonia solani AG-1 IA]